MSRAWRRGWLVWLAGCGGATEGPNEPPPCDLLYPGDASLTSVEEAATFFHQYAGTKGSLLMTDLPDMAVADRLCETREWLEIQRGSAVDLRGLERLEQAGGIQLQEMPALTSLTGLSGLEVVIGVLLLEDLPALRSLSGLDRLYALAALTVIRTGVERLVWDNSTLALSNVTIRENDALTEVDLRLRELGYLELLGPALTTVSLPELRGATQVFVSSDAPVSLSAPILESVSSLSLISASATFDLPALSSVGDLRLGGEVGGVLGVAGVGLISLWSDVIPSDLRGLSLPNLTHIDRLTGEAVYIAGWPDMPALQRIDEIDLRYFIGLPDLRWLDGVEIGIFVIAYADTASLSGLERLTTTDGFALAELPDLTDASGLASLATIGEGGATFLALPALTTLDLPALTEIQGNVLLQDTGLQDLSGLSALTSIGGDLEIIDNPGLDQQEIDAFLAHVTVGGEITVE